MQNRISKLFWVAAAVVCCAANICATTTTTLKLTGDVSGPVLGGVYTSPYYGTVGGTQTNVPIICDDFTSETYFNESWTVYETNLSTVPSSLLRWNSGFSWNGTQWVAGGLDQSTAYTVAAYLATAIMNAGSGTSLQKDLSYALWGLFDAGDSAGPFKGGFIGNPDLANAQQLLRDAETAVQTQNLHPSNYANVTIYSYDSAAGLPTGCGGTCPPPPQEFLRVSMAEPSFPGVLAIDLLAVVGLMVAFRRRMAGIFS